MHIVYYLYNLRNGKMARAYRGSVRPYHQVPLKVQKKSIFIKAYYKLNETRRQQGDFVFSKVSKFRSIQKKKVHNIISQAKNEFYFIGKP